MSTTAIQTRFRPRLPVGHFLRTHTWAFAAVATLVLLIANIVALPNFGNPKYYAGTLASLAPFAIVAMASTPAILSGGGGIDVSIGPLMGLVNILFVTELLPHGLGDVEIALPIMLLVGALVGLINGLAVTKLRQQPVIATVCMYFILGGLNLKLAGTPVGAHANWTDDLGNKIGPIPGALLTIGAPLAIWFGLRRTAFIRNLYSVGGDDAAAYAAGIRVAMVRTLAYVIGGVFAAIAGIALTAINRSADASIPPQYTLIAIAAVALGGTSLMGGRGGLAGALFGAAIIYLIQTLLASLHVTSDWLPVVYGLLLLIGIVTTALVSTGLPRLVPLARHRPRGEN